MKNRIPAKAGNFCMAPAKHFICKNVIRVRNAFQSSVQLRSTLPEIITLINGTISAYSFGVA
jgi:hypothetical protein